MSHSQEKVQSVFLVYRDEVRHASPGNTLDANMEECHFRGLPFDRSMKSLSILVVCYKESKLAGLKHKKKKLNLCDHHTPEALESPFARVPRNYKYHARQLIKFCAKVCDFIHIKGSYMYLRP